jgi:hypothetical protein
LVTVETTLHRLQAQSSPKVSAGGVIAITGVLTVIAVFVQGYHPFAEDGGLYLAGIKKILDPALYPSWSEFVTTQSRFSLFAPVVAALVHYSHVDLLTAILLIYVASIWSALVAAWLLAARCFGTIEACIGAASLLSLWLAMPVAGTSLMLMDPYVTARSISTPCSLFALVGAIDVQRYLKYASAIPAWKSVAYLVSAVIAEIAHPLMATYALACVVLFLALSLPNRKLRFAVTGGLLLLALATAVCIFKVGPPQSREYVEAAQTRAYWFIDTWQWYELLGLVAPPGIVAAIASLQTGHKRETRRLISQMVTLAGTVGITIAVMFARMSSESYAVARLQPLRIFQFIYLILLVMSGGILGAVILKRRIWRWGCLFIVSAGSMLVVQMQTYPHSAHLEFPWINSANGWQQAFLWIREHTPNNALFAVDAKYISAAGEDSQNFRAIAERSVLPDYSKDGGLAAIAPQLAMPWSYGESLQRHLDRASDSDRVDRLAPLAVSWLVLSSEAQTALPCPYKNESVKVCRMSEPPNVAQIAAH